MRAIRVVVVSALVVAAGLVWAFAPRAFASPAGSTAGPGQTISAAPAAVEVSPGNGATSGAARVLDDTGKVVAHGNLAVAAGDVLELPVPPLAEGSYLVDWSAGSAHGVYGFGIARAPAVVAQPKPETTLGPLADDVAGWAALMLVLGLVGVLALQVLVAGPAARRAGLGTDGDDRPSRRLRQIAAVVAALLVPMEIVAAAQTDSGWDFGTIWPSLGADGAGHVLGARLALVILAALILVPLGLRRVRPPVALTIAGLACGILELVGREVPTAVPPDWPRTVFNTVMYCFHLFGVAIWVGGLIGLLGLLALRTVPRGAGDEFWPVALRRFSVAASVSLGVVVLSGLWLYWVHVAGFHQLVATLYGKTLLVKLIVAVVLVLTGAANQFWLLPLMEARRSGGEVAGIARTVSRHLRATVAAEVVLALGVVFAATLLGGSARNQAFQASPQALAQTVRDGGRTVELYPSAMQPGLVDYNVRITGGTDPGPVVFEFTSPALGVAPQTVPATEVGIGSYRATGYYTPVAGDWEVTVEQGDGHRTPFAFPVTAEAPKPGKAPAPPVRWTTWLAGSLETLLVALVVWSSVRVSRRLTAVRFWPGLAARSTPPTDLLQPGAPGA